MRLIDRGLEAILMDGGGAAGLAAVAGLASLAVLGISTIYHVTYAANLPSIAEEGLLPGGGGAGVGRGGYENWSKGKVFLTGKDNLFHWFGRVEEHGESRSDNVHDDMLVPVVLRVKNLRRLLKEDAVAARENQSDSYYVRRRIPSSQLEAFTGDRWVPVNDLADSDTVMQEIVEPSMRRVEEDDGYYDWRLVRRETKQGPIEIMRTFPPKLWP